MTECPLMAGVMATTEEIKLETGFAPDGWMVAKRIEARFQKERDQRKQWETKYHELLHRTGGHG